MNMPEWLTAEYLRHLLYYDPDTGVWLWENPLPRSKMKSGDMAGRRMDSGRWQLRIASGYYYGSRLAWLYMTGEWPKDQIDHINRDKGDDRWINLREATQSQNSYNRDWCEDNGRMRGITSCGNQYAVNIGGRYHGLYRFIEEAIVVRECMLVMVAGNFATNEATQ